MRVLTSPAETGAATLALPQDVQTEAFDFPEELFHDRVWQIRRPPADAQSLARAAELIRSSTTPLIIAGGGVLYSQASEALSAFVTATGIPVAETQAGKGSLPYDHPQAVGAIGATGTLAANRLAREADCVIGIGTRYSDFTTASMTAFQNPQVRFININVAEFDAYKVAALPIIADARSAISALTDFLREYRVPATYANSVTKLKNAWELEVDRLFHLNSQPLPAQSEVIGAIWDAAGPRDVIVSAAGSHPGDLHKLWRTRTPNGYHMEYGYSCMGYEIPAAIGVKMADPSRTVYVFVGDGTYLMAPSEIVTSLQEDVKIVIVLVNNFGFASIGGLGSSIGSGGFGTEYRHRSSSGALDGAPLSVDYSANARSLGAHAIHAKDLAQFKDALQEAQTTDRTTVIVVETNRELRVPNYESWWDVAVAEVSQTPSVQEARTQYEESRKKERYFL
jgi:3D-(3,5/4)-trihydroxycyclohexane-1,2-dione acylhydrolase (decyclizing)